MTIIPKRLRAGDVIGIVSPSSAVTPDLAEQLENGVELLKTLGFRVVIGEYVHSTTLGYAASPEEKAQDMNRMFADDSVNAIICSQGGSTANTCLSYLDWESIRNNPKVFVGISDATVLLNAIHTETGLVTFHFGDVMWGLGRNPSAYDIEEFKSRLMDAQIGAVRPNRERRCIRSGGTEGRLLGGNLHALLKLAGTPYFPDLTGTVLFLEAMRIRTEDCDSLFQQMKQMGVFDKVRGVIIGFILGLQDDRQALMQMEDVLLRVTPEYDFPILKVDDFGHNCPNTVLPVGGEVRINADNGTIEILTECVR